MILFLNKCDLLKRKLRSGVMVKKYLPSYGERANDTNTVVKCRFFIFLFLFYSFLLFLFFVFFAFYLPCVKMNANASADVLSLCQI